ncbi:MAG: hypothetical protein KA712_13300 [Myxococcales bacterium]|nr:hypothetical protein [Myxococcales bacterium]
MSVGQSRTDDPTRRASWDTRGRAAQPAADERVVQVSTKCKSVDDFVARFSAFATEDSPRRAAHRAGEAA